MREHPQHPTAIAIIRNAVEVWRHRNRWSQSAVCDEIVSLHQRNGWDADTGIFFDPNPIEWRRQQTNAERIYRWLDDSSKQSNMLPTNFMRSILAAMPMDLRITVADQILAGVGLSARISEDTDQETMDPVSLVAGVAKECGEATAAIAHLIKDGSRDSLLNAQRELTEAIAEQQHALTLIEHRLS